MDDKAILDSLSTDSPVGIGGCRAAGDGSFDSCEYNVTVFDGHRDAADETIQRDGLFIRVSHGSLDDSGSDVLVNYDRMRAISDPSWELQAVLSKIRERRQSIFSDYAKNCLLDAIFCCTKAKAGIGSDVFAPCWQKSALIYLANSILALNRHRPTPSHTLEKLRNLGKNPVTDKISVVYDTLGIERATPSLLDRMCKSTIGFSERTEDSGHSVIIRAKHDYFVRNSMLADCYSYLTCINHANFVSIKDSVHRSPELIHILKVAFDLENDPEKLRQDTRTIQRTCNEILAGMA